MTARRLRAAPGSQRGPGLRRPLGVDHAGAGRGQVFGSVLTEALLAAAKVMPTARAEELSVAEFCALARAL